MIIDGASLGGGVGGGGGIDVPAVREFERDASSFGSLYRDVGVRLGAFEVALSYSMLWYSEQRSYMKELCVLYKYNTSCKRKASTVVLMYSRKRATEVQERKRGKYEMVNISLWRPCHKQFALSLPADLSTFPTNPMSVSHQTTTNASAHSFTVCTLTP
jgi:hypothetical protein